MPQPNETWILSLQGWFNIKLITVVHHISMSKRINHMIMLIDSDKARDGGMAQCWRALLLLRRTRVWFLVPSLGNLQLSVTPASWNPMPSSRLSRHLHTSLTHIFEISIWQNPTLLIVVTQLMRNRVPLEATCLSRPHRLPEIIAPKLYYLQHCMAY